MPSTATITTFYSFTANTKARANQVNANFDLFRGHLLPINPNTQTAIGSTYDLGSSEHRWKNGYFQQIDLQSNTTTGNDLKIVGDTSGATGAFLFKIAGTEQFRVDSGGAYKIMNKTFDGSNPSRNGFAAAVGIVSTYQFSVGSGEIKVPSSTLTVTTVGNPVMLGFTPHTSGTQPFMNIVTTGTAQSITFRFYNNTQAASALLWAGTYRPPIMSTTAITLGFIQPLPAVVAVISTLQAGTHNIFMTVQTDSAEARLFDFRNYAKEL